MTEQEANRKVSFSSVWQIRTLVLAVRYALQDDEFTPNAAILALEEIAAALGNL